MLGRYIVFSGLFLLMSVTTHSQALEIKNEYKLHNKFSENINTVIPDPYGGYLVGGYVNSLSTSSKDYYLAKLNSEFSMVWEKTYGDFRQEEVNSICRTHDGNFVIAGIANDAGRKSAYLQFIKVDYSGNEIWNREFMCSIGDKISKIITTTDDGILMVGSKMKPGDNDLNAWLYKIDKKGKQRWQNTFGERYYNDEGYDVIQPPDGGYVIAGYSPSEDYKNKEMVLFRIDHLNNLQWTKKYGGTKDDAGLHLIITPDQGFLVAGITQSKGQGGSDIWVVKTDGIGNKIWDRPYGSFYNDTITSLYDYNRKFIISGKSEMKSMAYVINQNGDIVTESYFSKDFDIAQVIATDGDNLLFAGTSVKDGISDGFLLEVDYNESANAIAAVEKIMSNRAVDGAGVDKQAPKVLVSSPTLSLNYASISGPKNITLKGTVSDPSGVAACRFNNEEVKLGPNGYFTKDVTLKEGFNDIFITAVDFKGNQVEEHITLEYLAGGATAGGFNVSGSYYAVIFAVNDYQDEDITDLDNPLKDGQLLYNVLTSKYSFDEQNVNFLKNPTRSQMIIALEEMAGKLTPEDNLLIFYAGHGYWDENTSTGYWLPADARKSNSANWFRNSTLRDFINGIKTKHTLLIADACFSGGIFKTRSAFVDASKAINKLYELPSRKAMTSGTLKEVPDESVFLKYLIDRLNDNTERYVSSESLFASFKTAVLNNSPNVPQFGEIKNTGDEGGDFIFIMK